MHSIPVQALGEFIGTFFLILLGDGVCAGVNLNKSKAQNSGWVVIALGWGLAVTMGVYTSAFLGPAHLNPAVTIAFAIGGKFPWSGVPLFVLAQMAGAILGAVAVWLHYLPHWEITEDKDLVLGTFATGPAVRSYGKNFISEFLGTFTLVFGLFAFTKGNFTEGLNPIVVGLLIVAIGLSLGGTTGYAINPARDFGPRLAHAILPIPGKRDSDWAYSWVPVVAPVAGGAVAALVFGLI